MTTHVMGVSKEEGARFEGARCLMELGDQIEGGQQSEVWGWGVKLGCRVEGCRDENRFKDLFQIWGTRVKNW